MACQAYAAQLWYEQNCCDSCSYVFRGITCAEVWDGQCCFVATMIEDGCGKGRPFFVEGTARTADLTGRADWRATLEDSQATLEPGIRAQIAKSWAEAALAEHASIASFARFILDLTGFGAPANLVADAASALGDEVRHAQLAFAVAGRYGAGECGPGPLPTLGIEPAQSLGAAVLAAVLEGCVGETLAAAEAELAAVRASDPTVRATLREIADDEARHATLAWRFVQWAIVADPALRPLVRDAAAKLSFAEPRAALSGAGAHQGTLNAHGVLTAEQLHAVRSRTMNDTVRPCLAALVA